MCKERKKEKKCWTTFVTFCQIELEYHKYIKNMQNINAVYKEIIVK